MSWGQLQLDGMSHLVLDAHQDMLLALTHSPHSISLNVFPFLILIIVHCSSYLKFTNAKELPRTLLLWLR